MKNVLKRHFLSQEITIKILNTSQGFVEWMKKIFTCDIDGADDLLLIIVTVVLFGFRGIIILVDGIFSVASRLPVNHKITDIINDPYEIQWFDKQYTKIK